MIYPTRPAPFEGLRLPMIIRQATTARPSPPFSADCLMLVFVTAGWATLRVPSGVISLESGYIVTIPEGQWYSLVPHGFVDIVTFCVHDDFLNAQLQWLPASHPIVHQTIAARSDEHAVGAISVGEARMRRLRPLLSTLVALEHAHASEFATLARVADLFDELSVLGTHTGGVTASNPTPRSRLPRRQIATAVRLLRNRLEHPWTVGELAQEVSMSGSQLSRLFRQELGISPAAFLWQARTDRMAELLGDTAMTVTQAAYQVGWASPSAASRAFKRRYGISPHTFAIQVRHAGAAHWTGRRAPAGVDATC